MRQFAEVITNTGEKIRILIETDIEPDPRTMEYKVRVLPAEYRITAEAASIYPTFTIG